MRERGACRADAFTGWGRAFKFQNWPIKRTPSTKSTIRPIMKFEHPTPEHNSPCLFGIALFVDDPRRPAQYEIIDCDVCFLG